MAVASNPSANPPVRLKKSALAQFKFASDTEMDDSRPPIAKRQRQRRPIRRHVIAGSRRYWEVAGESGLRPPRPSTPSRPLAWENHGRDRKSTRLNSSH